MEQPSIITKDDKIFAVQAVFFTIIGFVGAYILKKDNEYIMFYAKQSLVLFIIGLLSGLISIPGAWLMMNLIQQYDPIKIVAIFGAIMIIIRAALFILWVIALVNATSGTKKETPIIGRLARYLNF